MNRKVYNDIQKKFDRKYRCKLDIWVILLLASFLLTGCDGCGSRPSSGSSTSGSSTSGSSASGSSASGSPLTPAPPAPPTPQQQAALNAYLASPASSGVVTGATTGGDVVLKSIKFITRFDVCSDDVQNFSDDKNFWVLKIGSDFYHWLPATDRTGDPDHSHKPAVIPVTFTSTDFIEFEAKFEVINDLTQDPQIWVEDNQPGNLFTFGSPSGTINRTRGPYTLTFRSNVPFANTVKFINNFSLLFFNGNDFIGSSSNKLYLTYGRPLHGNSMALIGDSPAEGETLSVYYGPNGNKPCILETLLHIGCRFADGRTTEDDIVDGIFSYIRGLHVERVGHPGAAMGYWRGTSAATGHMAFREGRILLSTGEARCGEWTHFFRHICAIQSFNTNYKDFVIEPTGLVSAGFRNSLFLVKTWDVLDPRAPRDHGGRAQDVTNHPLNLFWDHVFVKYKSKYYDPSYGIASSISFPDDITLLNHYSSAALTGVLYAKPDPGGEPISDPHHTGGFIDPSGRLSASAAALNKYIYRTQTTSMASHLTITVS